MVSLKSQFLPAQPGIRRNQAACLVKFRAHTDPELANDPALKAEARKLGPNLVEVFDEDQMPRLFEKRSPKDPFFKTVEFIQTCVSD